MDNPKHVVFGEAYVRNMTDKELIQYGYIVEVALELARRAKEGKKYL